MKTERLNQLLTVIDDDLLEEAAATVTPEAFRSLPGPRHSRWKRWGTLAACLVLVACAAVLILPRLVSDEAPEEPEINPSGSGTEAEIDVISHWEDLELWQQYNQIEYQGRLYFAVGPTEESNVGEALEAATARGWDEYAQTEHTRSCQLYFLEDIAVEAGLAVQYEGDDRWYVCRTYDYTSRTLGGLIDDLSLLQHLTFGTISYDYFSEHGYVSETYAAPEPQMIWDLLLSDRTLVNEGSEHYGPALMSISVSVEVLGIHNLSMAVNQEGYLQTNLIATGASYHIGPEQVQAFMDYVLEHCQLLARRETRSEPEPESGAAEEPISVTSTPAFDPGA